jgi:tetratricopeptide (TPR) repeat protein
VGRRILRGRWLIPAAIVFVVLLTWTVSTGALQSAASRLGWTIPGVPASEPRPAAPGETLILISEFANYGGGQTGFNVAGRLQEALRSAFEGSGVEHARIELLHDTVPDDVAAQRVGGQLGADLVIWGEYDSGRVVAHISAPDAGKTTVSQERRWMIESAGELSTTINTDLPEDVQWMALFTLGRVHYMAGRGEQAQTVFQQALKLSPGDPNARGAIFDYLGLIESQKPAPDQNKVIAYYSEATELLPQLASILNNRGVAYVERDQEGDLGRATDDFRQAVRLDPGFGAAYLNLAIALLRDSPDNIDQATGFLEQAEAVEPSSPGIQNALCWDMSLAGSPDQALPHCDKAVQLDPSGFSNDSRGVALAMLGRRTEAVSEFRTFLSTLQAEDPGAYARYAPVRLAWIESLGKGSDPFDAATRRALLQE